MVSLLCMMKIYFSTGWYLFIDSVFCVLKGLIQLRNKGAYYCAVIKKRRYWPSVIPGKEMEDHFVGVELGETDAMQGTVDDVICNLWVMKEPNYLMRIMATGVRLLADDTCKETFIRWNENGSYVVKKFKYKLTFYWNFRSRHSVDDHNNLIHALPPIEYKWVKDRWECRVFAFILAISEVNSFLIIRYFVYCGLRQEGISTLLYFFVMWRGNLLTINTLVNGRGG